MTWAWDRALPGVLCLPSGRLVRGRGLRRPSPEGPPPQFGLYLLGERPDRAPWDSRWIRWPDFRLPADRADANDALREAWRRSETERVEIACDGGLGRTGTALACLAVLDGVPAAEAVAFVRDHYDAHAVETPGQRRYVARFQRPEPGKCSDRPSVFLTVCHQRSLSSQSPRSRRSPGPCRPTQSRPPNKFAPRRPKVRSWWSSASCRWSGTTYVHSRTRTVGSRSRTRAWMPFAWAAQSSTRATAVVGAPVVTTDQMASARGDRDRARRRVRPRQTSPARPGAGPVRPRPRRAAAAHRGRQGGDRRLHRCRGSHPDAVAAADAGADVYVVTALYTTGQERRLDVHMAARRDAPPPACRAGQI